VPHVASALEAMVKLCSDPQLVVDFFVNYDCDLQVPSAVQIYMLYESCDGRPCTSVGVEKRCIHSRRLRQHCSQHQVGSSVRIEATIHRCSRSRDQG